MKFRKLAAAGTGLAAIVVLGACSTPQAPSASGSAAGTGPITVTNCGKELKLDGPAKKLFVNDGNIVSLVLAAGGVDNITAVSSMNRDKPILEAKYGAEVVGKLKEVNDNYPTLEGVIAQSPDLMVAGWNYGFSEEKNLTPDLLKEKGINSYLLTESCRQEGTAKRGVVDPWEAVTTDVTNLGAITGHPDVAAKVVEDQKTRLADLDSAPKPEKKPVVFVFDSAKDTIFTSGFFGAPNAIIEKAGGTNATADVQDTWTTVSWEKLATAKPDVFVFVDYPGQTYQEKVDILKSHSVTKDFPAIKEKRFVNLPYALWTESPLNIDAAEYLRKALEKYNLAPASKVSTKLEMPADLPGREKLG